VHGIVSITQADSLYIPFTSYLITRIEMYHKRHELMKNYEVLDI